MVEGKGLALVTGASSGIGAVYARELAARGYDVLLVARRKDRLQEVARHIEEKHRVRAEVLTADLATDPGMRAVEERIAAAGDLTVLVNNAGFGIRGVFHESDRGLQEQMHRLHVIATMRLTHAALRGMVERGHGSIVNVSSAAAFAQSPWNTTYSATKTWMNAFTEALWLELKARRVSIKVQALCPGFTVTEFHDVMGVERTIVPDSWWMTPEEVVDASLKGLKRSQLIVIPGWRYQLYYLGLAVMPNFLRRRLTVVFANKVRKEMARRQGPCDARPGN